MATSTPTTEGAGKDRPVPKRFVDRATYIQIGAYAVFFVIVLVASLRGNEQRVIGMVVGWLLTNTGMDGTHARALQIFSRRRRRRDTRAAHRV